MKILYVHQYFKTPEEGGAIRSFLLARSLVEKGVEVEVITAHNNPFLEVKIIEGLKIHYLPIPYDQNFSFNKRLGAFMHFVIQSIITTRKIKNVDLSYVMTTPLTTGFIGLYNKWARKIPYIFEIGDLWPAVPIKMGIIKNRFIKSALFTLEKLFYRNAKGIVGLSVSISDYVSKLDPEQQVITIPNIANKKLFEPNLNEGLKVELGLTDEFVITYAGAFGIANHLEYLLESAEKVKHLGIVFLLVGEGSEKERITQIVVEKKLHNVKVLTKTNQEGVRQFLNISDAIFMSFLNIDVLHTGSPNKFFEGLAAGKMIISNLGGWTKKIIEQEMIGFVYNPECPDDFVEKIDVFLNDKDKINSCQVNAKKLAEVEFDLEFLAKKQHDFIHKIISNF